MSVFEFSDFREFIKFRISQQLYNTGGRKKSNLSRVAKSLGYSSPSLLSMVINGKRMPSDEFCEALLQSWNLPLKEKEYFRLLVQLDRKRRQGQDTTDTVEQIRRLTGNQAVRIFKDDEFSMIREWHFHVIQLLVDSPDFEEDPVWISKALRRKITPHQAESALQKMEQLGFLVRDPITKKLKTTESHSDTSHDIPSSSIRLHHKEMMHRALEALEERSVEERFFHSLAFHVDPKKIPEIREHLREFVRWINDEYSGKATETIFQLNLQFFEHTTTQQHTTTLQKIISGVSNETH